MRVHRAGEGAPYTGLKDGPVDPVAAMADQALADGAADDLAARIAAHLTGAMREKFERAHAASLVKDRDVEAGREFVEAYVDYMHYVEGVHAAIAATSSHDHGAGKGDAAEHEHRPADR
ncbi:MAG: hypothetical protein EHM19_06450 [Candidatus Latescibacterota bacterium]|nr:MAG: hypothetical protein EHM19_06450 [Candidatus Latescibacterota bacterium]